MNSITLTIAREQISEMRAEAERSRQRRQFRQARRAARAARRSAKAVRRGPSNSSLRAPGRIGILGVQ